VLQGDMIARSGNSGQSPFPHLHFDVQMCGLNLPPNYNQLPCGQTLPVTFRNTSRHTCGLVT
jgi:murein DD-endopeptidase MepM/ murein hydrolase activator NlpD